MAVTVYYDQLFIKTGMTQICVKFHDILSLEGDDHYVKIFTGYNTYHCARTRLKEMEENLAAYAFHRVHKSYIINMKKIKSIQGNIITLLENKDVPLQKSHYKAFFEKIWSL